MGWFSDTLNKIKQAAVDAPDSFQTTLEFVGLTPLIGNIADLGNAAIYKAKGEDAKAALALAAAIPGLGQFTTGGKLAKKTADAAIDATKAAQKAGKQVKAAQSKVKASKEIAQEAKKELSDATSALPIPSPARLDEMRGGVQSTRKVLKEARDKSMAAKGKQRAATKTAKEAQQTASDAAGVVSKVKNTVTAPFGRGKGLRSNLIGGNETFGMGRGANIIGAGSQAFVGRSEEVEPTKEDKPKDKTEEKDKVEPLLGDDKGQGKGEGKGEGDAPTGETDQQPEPTEQTPTPSVEDKEAAAKKREDDILNQKYDIAAQMDDLMTQDPDYFRKNRGAAQQLFGKARKLGVTAEQFNNYVRNNRAAAQERRRDIDRAEAKQFLQEKLDQPLYESSRGMPTYAQRGRNLAEFLKSSGLKNATPAQVSSLMNPNRGAVLQQVKQEKEKTKK